MPARSQSESRCILLLSDDWSATMEGVCGINRSLALALSRYKGIRVYTTIFRPLSDLSTQDRELADSHGITLVSLASGDASTSELYALFNDDPVEFFRQEVKNMPGVSHIVGHSPLTAEAALKLREAVYPDCKVVLFYHIIPREAEWLAERLPYVVPTDSEQVRLAELADVVYSVSEKLHWFYTAKFRNRASVDVDHRLFLPQSQEDVFQIQHESGSDTPRIITTGYHARAQAQWSGLDISACAVNKVGDSADAKRPSLKVGGVQESRDRPEVEQQLSEFCTHQDLDVSSGDCTQDLYHDLGSCTLCVLPSRAEPFGYSGLDALSAGIPTLLSEDSGLASIIKRLTSEPESFLVPVTPATASVRQDGSVWRDRILAILRDPEGARDRATQLKMALRRDETTKETHDNFVSYCLGGISIKHELNYLNFVYRKDDDKELPVTRSFNKFMQAALKQCWRYKHHPLTTDSDLYQLLPGVDLPIKELVAKVTDKIEEYDRRIVGVDKTSGSFTIYCPTPEALSDLWAMCDVINRTLHATLLSGEENAVLAKFKLKSVGVRTIISGPEFLQYKTELVGGDNSEE